MQPKCSAAATRADKSSLRSRVLAARRELPAEVRVSEAAALAEHLAGLAVNGDTVCAYVPVGSEPGSPTMLDTLARRGLRVLLPVVSTDADDTPLPLRWGRYRPGELVAGRFGLLEPAPPHLPAAALADAAAVIVPALAVDRRGVRLGRGAGFYDRSLALRRPGTALLAVVRDSELVDELPAEPHDVLMTHALMPTRGVVALPGVAQRPE